MGNRAAVLINGVYLYTHWEGDRLPSIVQRALAKKERWNDESYLARIIFCEMIKKAEDEFTGFGIFHYEPDCNHDIINLSDGMVSTDNFIGYSYDRYITIPKVSWKDLT